MILDCPICQQLPQKYQAGDFYQDDDEVISAAMHQLKAIEAGLKTCPHCSTLYEYTETYDPGEPMVPSSTSISLMRISPYVAAALFPSAVLPDTSLPLEECIAALKKNTLPQNLNLRKYICEYITDFALQQQDEAFFIRTLLQHPDAEIAVSACQDIVFIATEEYPVWGVRFFTRSQKAIARNWLGNPGSDLHSEILNTLRHHFFAEQKTIQYESAGGNEIPVWYKGYHTLSNLIFRGFPISAVYPQILKQLSQTTGNKALYQRTFELISDSVKKFPDEKEKIIMALNAFPAAAFHPGLREEIQAL